MNELKSLKKFSPVKSAYIFSCLFACSIVIGRIVYKSNSVKGIFFPAKNLIISFLLLILITVVIGTVLSVWFSSLTNKYKYKQTVPPIGNNIMEKVLCGKGLLYKLWAVIFVSWLPCYISFYPGITAYDIIVQTQYAIAGFSGYSKYHPPLHTMIWALFYNIEQITGIKATSSYGITQMLFLSFVFSKTLCWLYNKKISWKWIIGALLFYALNPVIALMSFIPTKDVYFAGVLIWFTVNYLELINSEGKIKSNKQIAGYILSGVLCCLFRNNALYVVVVSFIILIIIFRKKKTDIWILFISTMVLFVFINSVIFSALHIGPGSTREKLCIPIQQISKVVTENGDRLEDDTKMHIGEYMDYAQIADSYNPRFADPCKALFSNPAYLYDKKGFWDVYFQLMKEYPELYIDAAVSLHIPYWYPFASATDEYSKRVYIETQTGQNDYYNIERYGYLPKIYEFYRSVSLFDAFKTFPPLAFLFSLAFPIWLIVFCGFVINAKGYGISLFYLAPSVSLWLTYLLGPVSNFRYVFPLVVLYPVYIISMVKPEIIFSDKH